MKSQSPRQRRLLILLALSFIVCGGLCAPQVSDAQTQTPAAVQTPTPAPEQTDEPPPPPALPVRLDVIVSDESNRFVAGLRPEDFHVEVNGVPQKIMSFSDEAPPLSYSLLVDNTGSLRTLFDPVLRTGAAIIAGKSPRDEMSVVRFVSRERIQLMQDFTRNPNALVAALDEMYIEGGHTALLEALYVAAETVVTRTPGADGSRALVVITDGGERDPRTKLDEVLKYLRRHNVPVFVLGLTDAMSGDDFDQVKGGRRGARELLETLARETGGHAVFPKKPAEFEDAALALNARLLMPRYTLGFTSSLAAMNKPLKIEVKLADSVRNDERKPRLLRVNFRMRGANAPTRK
ncbi:MAG TPA: VWA domain-containing protein [Pyrinomonadaceae bacterium]|jgi:VWFA-related protein